MHNFYFVKFYIQPELLGGEGGFLTYRDYVVGSFNSFYVCYGKRAIGIALNMNDSELKFFMRFDDRATNLHRYLYELKRIFIIEVFGSLDPCNEESDDIENNMSSIEKIETLFMKEVDFEYCQKVLRSIFDRGTDCFKNYFMENFLKIEEERFDKELKREGHQLF